MAAPDFRVALGEWLDHLDERLAAADRDAPHVAMALPVGDDVTDPADAAPDTVKGIYPSAADAMLGAAELCDVLNDGYDPPIWRPHIARFYDLDGSELR